MSNSKLKKISVEYQDSVIYDPDGNEVLRLGQKLETYEDENGCIITMKESENIQCSNGRIYNFSEAQKPDPTYLSICEACRSEPVWPGKKKYFFIPANEIRKCFKCGIAVCCRHYVISKIGHIVCRKCHKKQSLVSLLRPLFFRKVQT